MTKKVLVILLSMVLFWAWLCVAAGESTAAAPDRKISFEKEKLILYVGKQEKMNPVVTNLLDTAPKQTTFEWKSSDPGIASVNSAGFVRGVAAGKTTITASAKDNEAVFALVEVEVRVPVQAVTINEKNVSVVVGGSDDAAKIQLTVTIRPENASVQTGTWSSSDEKAAVVDQNGLVTGISTGRAVITFTSDDPNGPKKSQVNVGIGQAVQAISLSGQGGNLPKGRTMTLKAAVEPANATNKRLSWKSSDETVATVNANGLVKGIAAGTTTITAKAEDGTGIEASCSITVVSPVKALKTSENSLTLAPKVDWLVTAVIEPEDATIRDIVWSSSDESVATVSSEGVVTAVANGKATITAAAQDGSGIKKTIPVTVKHFDFVITKPSGADVRIDIPSNGIWGMGFRSKTHCVSSDSEHMKPLKAGTDTFTVVMQELFTRKVRKIRYSVLVTPSAVK